MRARALCSLSWLRLWEYKDKATILILVLVVTHLHVTQARLTLNPNEVGFVGQICFLPMESLPRSYLHVAQRTEKESPHPACEEMLPMGAQLPINVEYSLL